VVGELPTERLGEIRAAEQPERGAAGEHRRDHALGGGDLLRRERLADHGEGEREHRHPDPLDAAHGDEQVELLAPVEARGGADLRGEARQDDRDRVGGQDHQEHPLFPVDVPKAAEHRRRHDAHEEVGRQDPRDRRDRRAPEEHLEPDQGGDHHRLDVHHHQGARGEDDQHAPRLARVEPGSGGGVGGAGHRTGDATRGL
jgi:hypothetical protein